MGRSADDRFARVRQDTDTETDKRTDKRETATDNQVTTRLSRSGRFRAFEWGKKKWCRREEGAGTHHYHSTPTTTTDCQLSRKGPDKN